VNAAESPAHDLALSAELRSARLISNTQIALLFRARDGGPFTCSAIDTDSAAWWASAGASLLGVIIQPNPTLASARRQNRAVAVPTAELPAYTGRGARFSAHDLPPWATAIPLHVARGEEALLVLVGNAPMRGIGASAEWADLDACSARLARLLRGGAHDSLESLPRGRIEDPPRAIAPSIDGVALLLGLPLVGAVVARPDGTIVVANEEGRRAIGALQGTETDRLSHPALLALLEQIPHARAAQEIEAVDVDGAHRFLRVAAAHQDGMVLLSLQEVTDERLMHERLLQSEKMASIGQLVSGVAHELNNPLTGIMGFAQLLLSREELPESLRRDISTIFDEAERAARIVQNLLSFARRRRAEKEPVDLNDLVERVLELRSYDLRVHNIEPRAKLSRTLGPVLADPHQIQQVLLNVIRNAEHAIRERGGHGTITVSTSTAGAFARVVVADDGGGIAPENLRRIFDPFFTTKPPGEGTGLGLTIVYGILEEHGGHVHVESKLGKGATFQFELPLAEGSSEPRRDTPTRATRRASGRSILVIDDEASIREVLLILLSRDGHEVETVADGLGALERLAERDFDLIITDVRMPGVDGIEFYNRVRAWNPAVAERIVFTTGDIVNPTTRDFLASVSNQHLQKPFSLAEVRDMISLLLKG
jgi:signal transduction histidine kinase